MGAEADVMPYWITRYFGLRSFAVLASLPRYSVSTGGGLGPPESHFNPSAKNKFVTARR